MSNPGRWIRLLLAVTLAVAGAACPQRSSAAACCVSATSFGVGRLLAWEDAAAGMQVGHARSLGQWGPGGSLRWNGSDFSDGLTTVQAFGLLRLHERVQLQAWLPVVVNDRRSGGESQIAWGLGDVGLAGRVEVLKIGEYLGLPSLAVTLGGLAPTGRRVEETSPPLFAGATGRGSWGASLAIETEWARLRWFVRLDAGATVFRSFRRADTGQEQRYGPLLQASLSAGRELLPDVLVAAIALGGEWEAPIVLEGEPVPSSRARTFALTGSLAWRLDPRWTLTGAVHGNVWPDGVGMNRDARLGFTLGVRHGHF